MSKLVVTSLWKWQTCYGFPTVTAQLVLDTPQPRLEIYRQLARRTRARTVPDWQLLYENLYRLKLASSSK